MTTKIDMSYNNSGSFPCCSPSDCHYPIGFFLSPKQIEQLGISDTVKPGDTMDVAATIKITSVTSKEKETELYAVVTEMGIVSKEKKAKPTAGELMAGAYKGADDGNE